MPCRLKTTTRATHKPSSALELQTWLESNGVDTDCYGKGTAKTIEDLLEEERRLESTLDIEDGKALRVVKVLSLWVTNSKGQVLFEEEQVLPDGRSRCRNLALSEKLIGDEEWRSAVERAVHEELGSILPPQPYRITVFDHTYKLLTHKAFSMSYPCLATRYYFHRVSAEVAGLPDGPFETYEARPNGQLVSKWVWKSREELPNDPADPLCSSS